MLLSLCMPTNGISEWVFPSLKSIYEQGVDESLFEVIIMDNGNNSDFSQKVIDYSKEHENLRYFHTDKPLFLSEPESYKKATGEFIKFINHRNIMCEGSIQYLIDFVNNNRNEKPVIYFTNGFTETNNRVCQFSTFSKFVVGLEYFSSWSSGMGIWKTDLDEMAINEYNYLFPHTDILFYRRKAFKYIIDGSNLWNEQETGKKPKGKYDLFYAFAVEYPGIVFDLVRSSDLEMDDFITFKNSLRDFLSDLYLEYIVLKKYCSYDLTGYKRSLKVYYSEREILINIVTKIIRKVIKKIKYLFH